MTDKTNDYEEQAEIFLKKTGTEYKANFLRNGLYFDDDKEERDIYEITLKRGEREFIFTFGNSLYNSVKWKIFSNKGVIKTSDDRIARKYPAGQRKLNEHFKAPSAYCVLACLQKYEVGTFKEFCSDYGYNEDSIKAFKSYNAVCKEWENIKQLYSDKEIKQLREIQ